MSEPVHDGKIYNSLMKFSHVDLLKDSKKFRLHVGGLAGKINAKDLEERFRSFGAVQKVDIIPHPFEGKLKLKGWLY